MEMAEVDKAKTAFSYGQGLLQFRVLSFGLVNAPATFAHFMEQALAGLLWKGVLVYLDDVTVYVESFQEEVGRLRAVLEKFRVVNLKVKP